MVWTVVTFNWWDWVRVRFRWIIGKRIVRRQNSWATLEVWRPIGLGGLFSLGPKGLTLSCWALSPVRTQKVDCAWIKGCAGNGKGGPLDWSRLGPFLAGLETGGDFWGTRKVGAQGVPNLKGGNRGTGAR